MASHLNRDRWFRKTSTGTLMMLRVSAEAEQQFHREYRTVYRDAHNTGRAAAAALCRHLMDSKGYSLSEAWTAVKRMFNS